MSVFAEIDRLLRHSVLARVQPFLRARTPWLHHALLVSRDVVLPFKSRYGLHRYQHRAIERFCSFAPDRSDTTLEIGSDLRGGALKELASRGFRRMVGLNVEVDPDAHGGRGSDDVPEYEIVQGDVRRLPFGDASMSSIVSITAFEHVHGMGAALDEMHRVLKPGAILYSEFGPIWSCSIGHHVEAMVDGVEARHYLPGRNPVPHFAHLLMSRDELREAVLRRRWVSPGLADAIVAWIHDEAGLNRLYYEDYVSLFRASRFAVRRLKPVREHVARDVQRKLETACPGYTEFGVRMVEVVLEKR